MQNSSMFDTLWIVLIILGAGGLALGLCLMFKIKADRQQLRRRWDRTRTRTERYARDS